MKIKHYLASLFLIFCAAGFLFAQNKKSPSDEYVEQLQIEREDAANSKRAGEFLALRTAALFPDLNLFLPSENESWAVSITANGGIMGGSRLLAAVNSDGNYVCSSKNAEFRNRFVDKKIFAEIARIAKGGFSLLNPVKNTLNLPPISYCSDCSYETFNFVLRRDKTVKVFQFNLKELAESAPELMLIYEKVSNTPECR